MTTTLRNRCNCAEYGRVDVSLTYVLVKAQSRRERTLLTTLSAVYDRPNNYFAPAKKPPFGAYGINMLMHIQRVL